MFQRIKLKHFKAFDSLDISLAPITVFLGPNNSGKSSILASLRLLAQTVSSYDKNITLLLNGGMGDFGTYKDIVFKNFPKTTFEITVELKYSPKNFFYRAKSKGREKSLQYSLCYEWRALRKEIVLKSFGTSEDGNALLITKFNKESDKHLVHSIGKWVVPQNLKSSLSNYLRMKNFLADMMLGFNPHEMPKSITDESAKEITEILRNSQSGTFALYRHLERLEYVGAMRQPPSRSYLHSGERRNKVGASGEHAASILAMDSFRGGSKTKNICDNVSDWLKKAGMASQIKIDSISDRHFEIKVQHPITKEYENYADVGYGNSQVIPVLVAGYNLDKGNTLIVEEPEIHLHPKAQAELGDFFLKLYDKNIQTFIETHSEHLILRLQQHVATGKIRPDDIKLYYVHVDASLKKATLMEMDSHGVFKNEWPEGFFPERLEEAKNLAKARMVSGEKNESDCN